ncbi:MAG: phosphoribosyl-ATP diphosphatase [Alphaproteobacteria bacterium]
MSTSIVYKKNECDILYIMTKYEKLVTEFHQVYKCAIDEPYSIELLNLRKKLLTEELEELSVEIDAMAEDIKSTGKPNPENKTKMFKELADLQYVLSGMVVALGIPLEEVFEEVHKSNLSKLVDGKPLYREDGKVLKGPNYFCPDLKRFE